MMLKIWVAHAETAEQAEWLYRGEGLQVTRHGHWRSPFRYFLTLEAALMAKMQNDIRFSEWEVPDWALSGDDASKAFLRIGD